MKDKKGGISLNLLLELAGGMYNTRYSRSLAHAIGVKGAILYRHLLDNDPTSLKKGKERD